MKSFKTIVSLLTVAAMLFLLPGGNAMQVSADEPVTYSLKYVEENGEWRFHVGAWDDTNSGHRELYYLKESIKDGDQIVIEEGNNPLNLELSVNLKSITFNHSGNAVITAKSTENVYVLRDSVAAVNGDVINAYVYDNAVANFNNNVTNLYITKERSGEQTIAVVGTVAYAKTSDAEQIYNEFYNFEAGSFYQEKGILKTDASKYSATPTTDSTSTTQSAADTSTSVSADSSAASDSEYDDVPKTGESFLPYLLLMAAGICFGSAYLLHRKERV